MTDEKGEDPEVPSVEGDEVRDRGGFQVAASAVSRMRFLSQAQGGQQFEGPVENRRRRKDAHRLLAVPQGARQLDRLRSSPVDGRTRRGSVLTWMNSWRTCGVSPSWLPPFATSRSTNRRTARWSGHLPSPSAPRCRYRGRGSPRAHLVQQLAPRPAPSQPPAPVRGDVDDRARRSSLALEYSDMASRISSATGLPRRAAIDLSSWYGFSGR